MRRVCPVCQQESEAAACPVDGAPTVMVGLGAQALVGQVVLQRYRIEALIGEGGFGAVYRAVHTGTGDVVAVKVLRNDQQTSPEMVARFQQEAAVTARLKQPHTVRVFDFGQMESGDLFLAMEFLDGRTLTAAMAGPPMSAAQIVRIASQVGKSLAEAHDSGLVHRDLKPDNIFLQRIHGEEEFVKVLDFGIAKSLVGASGAKTATGIIVGTPPYMSPEQARGTGVDVRTDVYALGCILYELLTGQVPFPGESALDTLIRRITEPPPRAHERLRVQAPTALCDVVLRAMATEPHDRYASATELVAALQQAVTGPSMPMPAVESPVAPQPAVGSSSAWMAPAAQSGVHEAHAARMIAADSGRVVEPEPTTVSRAPSSSRLSLPVRAPTTRVMQQKRPPMALVVGGGVAVVALASLTLLARPNAQPMPSPTTVAAPPSAPLPPAPAEQHVPAVRAEAPVRPEPPAAAVPPAADEGAKAAEAVPPAPTQVSPPLAVPIEAKQPELKPAKAKTPKPRKATVEEDFRLP